MNSFALLNSNGTGCRCVGPGKTGWDRRSSTGTNRDIGGVRAGGVVRGGGETLKGGGRRKGGSTCLPFLQEPPGLVSTNRLMSPKLVLHVLVAQGFEVGGQRAVQQQDAPVQGPHPRDVRGRHSAARGPGAADSACARGGARRLRAGDRGARGPAEVGVRPLTGLVRPKIRTFRKRSYGGGRGTGRSLSGRGVESGRSRGRAASGSERMPTTR